MTIYTCQSLLPFTILETTHFFNFGSEFNFVKDPNGIEYIAQQFAATYQRPE